MDISFLLFGILPLLVFVIIDSISGVKAGVAAAMAFSVLEAAYTLLVYETIDGLTLGSCLLVVVFGLLSYRYQKPIYMKLQPVFLGLTLAVALLVMQLLGKPLLVLMVEKYQYMLPEQYRSLILHPHYLMLLGHLSGVLSAGFFLHAGFVAYAAFFLNTWWWIAIRGVGLYAMLAMCALYVRLT